jgi:hypothetical protein
MKESTELDLNELRLQPATHWLDHGISIAWIKEESEWLRRDSGSPGSIDGFFDCAGRLMLLCGYDYYLLGPMFYHAVIGLEAMMRVHYKATDKDRFSELLDRAEKEGLFHDGVFSEIRPLHACFKGKVAKGVISHAAKLASLLPTLRNAYLHGGYQFHPDYLHLAVQLRELADTLTMPRTPAWKL